jgi:TPR repeat protein
MPIEYPRYDRRPKHRRGTVKRLTWIAGLTLVAALAGFGCSEQAESEPQRLEVSTGEEDAYQTAVFNRQRAEWQALAEQGDARSQRQLGMMYYLGQGMDVDHATAAEWMSKAAQQGDAVAQVTLGVMHREGHGVPQSLVSAHMWFSLAERQGNRNAGIHLEELVPEMSPEEIEEARTLADEWKPTF